MIFKKKKYFFLFSVLLILKGQIKKSELLGKKIYLLHADIIKKKININKNVLFLYGHVSFKHKENILYCNNAVYYKKQNKFQGFGRVIISSKNRKLIGGRIEYNGNNGIIKIYERPIILEKKIKIQSDILYYNLHTKISKAIGNVFFTYNNICINSPIIEYNANNKQVYYNLGGILYNKKNILKSKKAIFLLKEKKVLFSSHVSIENKEYKIFSQKILYYINKKKINFLGPTVIRKKLNPKEYIYTEEGSYLIEEKKAYGRKSSSFHYNKKIIKGDKLFFDQKKKFGIIIGNVLLEDLDKKRFLIGSYGEIHQSSHSIIFLNNPVVIKIIKNDFILISANKIIIKKTPKLSNVLYAYNSIELYKNNIQAKCNFIIYNESKGNIILYKNPIIWLNDQQIIGDKIYIYFNSKKEILNSIKVIEHAFLISKINSFNSITFNQLQGNLMNFYFKKNQINNIKIQGNAKILFLNTEKDINIKNNNCININKSNCGYIIVLFNKYGKPQEIFCKNGAYSKFFTKKKIFKIKHFLSSKWNSKKKPIKKEKIFFQKIIDYNKEQKKEQKLIKNLEK